MELWKETLEKVGNRKNHQVWIASHRGKFSSSVMENTSLAFLTAIAEGADMVEMDLIQTKDGRIVAHHDDTMERLFHDPARVADQTLSQLKHRTVYNYIGEPCEEGIETFDEILEALKDRAILVLDRCWNCWDTVYKLLCANGMEDQVYYKFYIEDEDACAWAERHGSCRFIPMVKEVSAIGRVLELKQYADIPALEILPEKEEDAIFQRETLAFLHEKGMKVWCNSLSLSKNLVYGAGFDDLKSLRDGGDCGWGRLISQGVDIIQTDWPWELKSYLKGRSN